MKRTIIYDDWNLHVSTPEIEGCCGSCHHFENEDAEGIGTCAAHLHDVTYCEYVCSMYLKQEREYYGDDCGRAE